MVGVINYKPQGVPLKVCGQYECANFKVLPAWSDFCNLPLRILPTLSSFIVHIPAETSNNTSNKRNRTHNKVYMFIANLYYFL